MSITDRRYIERTLSQLFGIIEGITIDCNLSENEIVGLYNWMERHIYLEKIEPFRGLWELLNDILQDQVIDEAEKDELLEWCAEAVDERGFLEGFTDVIRTLHGLLTGIIADKKITEDELSGLRDWIMDYEHLRTWWPINELSAIVDNILKDGVVDKDEQSTLLEFFNDFVEQPLGQVTLHDKEYVFDDQLRSHAPFLKPVSSICEKKPEIDFSSGKFCFTGPAVTGSRKDLSTMVKKLGGTVHKTIVKNLDYLIIGAQSSPAWVYATYGRKIETAMATKNSEHPVKLIHEKNFVSAALEKGGKRILPDPKSPPFELTY